MELREYQKAAIGALWLWFKQNPQGAPLLVIPTGGGKSLVLASIAKTIAGRGPKHRILIVVDSQELVQQNFEELSRLWPFGSIGKYSAGLKARDTSAQVIVAGIQSVYQRAAELGPFSLVMVDECHMTPPDGEGMYRTFFAGMLEQNPGVRFVGLTATPYRLGSGLLTQAGGLWTDVAFEVGIADLIKLGHLCPLVSKAGTASIDTSRLAVRAGEYQAEAAEKAFNQLDLVEAALEEVTRLGAGRKSWLLFASGVSHAERIHQVLNRVGIATGLVTGNTPPLFREQAIREFKAGHLRALVNVDVLKKGFNHPGVDLVAILRATQSTALWVQMVGRGTRLAEGKTDCLVLDYGQHCQRLGPVDKVQITYRRCPLTGKTEGRVEAPPVKVCPHCRTVSLLSARECIDCGQPFPEPTRVQHEAQASSTPVLSVPPKPIEVTVFGTSYAKHEKKDSPVPTLRADHTLIQLGELPVSKVSEWVCLEHEGFALRKAVAWWRGRSTDPTQDYPNSVGEAVERAKAGELRAPKRLRIVQDGKFWRVAAVLEFYPDDHIQEEERDLLFEEEGINV
jgi:DNA repair protein RadD